MVMVFEWVLYIGLMLGLFFTVVLLLIGYVKVVVVKQESIAEELKKDGISEKSV
jgi:hypothetical protein